MKKYLLLALTSLFSASLYAQPTQTNIVLKASTKTTVEATPRQIIDSLKRRFPNAKAVQAYKTSPEALKNGWLVTKEDNLGSSRGDVERYTLSFKNADFQCYGLFEADGTLLRGKFQQNNAKLPKAAQASILKVGADDFYKGYKVVSKTYFKQINYKQHSDYYEVVVVNAHNENIKKVITLDEKGKQVKEVDL
ncbi:MAG TPA: hypothetical protein VGN20_05725 [Mucilaginibacter sp.]|jgi:hypothetical protein